MRENRARKVLVIGLDGATWQNLLPLASRGDMPVLKGLLDRGCHGVLRSTLPCVTPPAWGSFLTGSSPARHGVLDFTERLDQDLFQFVTFRSLAVPKLWHALSHFGRRSIFIGVPFTYPPDAIKGIVIPGPPVPPKGIATHPPALAAQLLERFPDYTVELDYQRRSQILAEIYRSTENQRELALWLMEREPWDLFMVTFIATDRLHHKFWHEGAVVAEYYRGLDRTLGAIIGRAGTDACVVLMSDHGFTAVRTKFFPNQWLADRGFLAARFTTPGKEWNPRLLNPTARRRTSRGKVFGWRKLLRLIPGCADLRWTIDLPRTRAFASFGHLTGVFVNVKGRYAHGAVEPGDEYEQVRDALIQNLGALREPGTGEPVFRRVARREDFFSGPFVERMPDVICDLEDHAVRLRTNLGVGRVFAPFRKRKSYHAPDGILLAAGPGIRPAIRLADAAIQDVAPLILRLMDLPRLSSMDGRVPPGALDPACFGAEPPPAPAEEIDFVRRSHAFSDEEQEAITRDLEALGYL